MPKHSKSSDHSSSKEARHDSSGGGDWTIATRTLVSGRQLGKSAIHALHKNSRTIQIVEELLRESKNLVTDLIKSAITFGRVVRPIGAGRLEVVVLTFDKSVSSIERIPIAKTMRFKGIASNKTDRANCMCGGDMIVICGGFASAKLPLVTVDLIQIAFRDAGIYAPKGFFTITPVYEVDSAIAENDDGIEFERI